MLQVIDIAFVSVVMLDPVQNSRSRPQCGRVAFFTEYLPDFLESRICVLVGEIHSDLPFPGERLFSGFAVEVGGAEVKDAAYLFCVVYWFHCFGWLFWHMKKPGVP